jgi:uncharacterized protein (DUF433 family)
VNKQPFACQHSRRIKMGDVNMRDFDRITQNPAVMGGKACIRGMRVTVSMIVGQIGVGHGIEDLLSDYPYLEREDILQALRYAAWLAEGHEVMLAAS